MAELAQTHHSDVTILDATSLDVPELFQQLGQARVRLFGKLIVLTLGGVNEEMLFFLAKWGVAAHTSAWTQPEELTGILRNVALGEYLLTSKSLLERRVSALHSRRAKAITLSPTPPEPQVPVSPLTAREVDVLVGIAQGKTNREIALALKIRETSVRRALSASYRKLAVDNRTSAVICALRRRWIVVPEILGVRATKAVA